MTEYESVVVGIRTAGQVSSRSYFRMCFKWQIVSACPNSKYLCSAVC